LETVIKTEAYSGDVNRSDCSPLSEPMNLLLSSTYHVPLGIVVAERYASGNDKVVYSNAEFQRISGYTRDELLGMRTSALYLPEDWKEIVDTCNKMLQGSIVYPHEWRLLRKDNGIAWVMKIVSPVKYAGRDAIMASFMDISDKKIDAQKIEQLNLTLNTMLDIHHLIARQKNMGPLMQGICDRLVSRPGYYTAAIFLLSENGSGLKYYHAGDCFYDSVYNDFPKRDFPVCVKLALDAHNMVWLDSRKKCCRDCLLVNNCSERQKVISVRLKHSKNTYGVLVVSLSEDLAFLQEEQRMLRDICNDISFAIDSINQNNVSARLQKRLKISERELKRLNENMKCYVQEITEAQEQERKRIASDLHDDTVQRLASIKLDLFNTICEEEFSGRAQDKVEQIVTRVGSLLDEVNQICYTLRPGLLDQLGLAQAVELLAKEIFRPQYGIAYDLEIIGKKKRLEPQVETNLYRIAQEAMNNVVKHSKADSVRVVLTFLRNKVRISIQDNGIGFKKPRRLEDFVRFSKLGLTGIRERSRLIKGDCQIRSSVGIGTSINVEAPI